MVLDLKFPYSLDQPLSLPLTLVISGNGNSTVPPIGSPNGLYYLAGMYNNKPYYVGQDLTSTWLLFAEGIYWFLCDDFNNKNYWYLDSNTYLPPPYLIHQTGQTTGQPIITLGALTDLYFLNNPVSIQGDLFLPENTVYAYSYYGNGSALTGIPMTQAVGNNGNIQYTDGSGTFLSSDTLNWNTIDNILNVYQVNCQILQAQSMPTSDQFDGVTLWYDSVTKIVRMSS